MAEPQEATAVWATNHLRHVNGNPLWWPAIRCQPDDVPGAVPPPVSNRVLVRYTGPPCSKEKEFDCYWVTPVEVVDFENFRSEFQAQASGPHEEDMAVAIQEAEDHVQSVTGLETERASLEEDLRFVVDNIPDINQAGFRVYAEERASALVVSGCPVGDKVLLNDVLATEYQNLPEPQRREHERLGKVEYQSVMTKARNILQSRGKRYLDLCEKLTVAAHPVLLPIIRLLLVPDVAPTSPPANQNQPKMQSLKRERQESNGVTHQNQSTNGGHLYTSSDDKSMPRKVQKTMALTPSPLSNGNEHAEHPRLVAPAQPPLKLPPDDLTVKVMCNGYEGVLYPAFSKVIHKQREFTAPQFEQYCGAGSTKKWKISLRVVPGSVPECPLGERPMLVGKWLDMCGYASGNLRTKSGQSMGKFIHSG